MMEAKRWIVLGCRHVYRTGEQDVECVNPDDDEDVIGVLLPPIEYLIQTGDFLDFRMSDPDTVSEFRINETGPWVSVLQAALNSLR